MVLHKYLVLGRLSSQVCKRMYSSNTNEVLFEVQNKRGIITLNKPKILNSLNYNMVLLMANKLKEWEDEVEMIILKSEGGKAFCAGGDIVDLVKEGPKNHAQGKKFFRTEYILDNTLATYKKPVIALIDGITMGGGVGISIHGKYRVATEKTMFAMPETAIGLFPDVGTAYVLPRLRGQLGMFLGLTGQRLKGIDVVKAGIATHYCEAQHLPQLYNALVSMKTPVQDIEKDVFKKFTKDVSSYPFCLETKMDEIDRIFKKPTVEEIFEELRTSGSPWALETLETLKKMSPFSLKITKKYLDMAKQLTLQEVFQFDARIGGALLEGHTTLDFYEGVRALLIDKDKNPKWNPKDLCDITDEMVEKMFQPLADHEELII